MAAGRFVWGTLISLATTACGANKPTPTPPQPEPEPTKDRSYTVKTKGHLAWSSSADLNGDGRNESVRLTYRKTNDPEASNHYEAVIEIQDQDRVFEAKVPSFWLSREGGKFKWDHKISIIDVDNRDSAREVWLEQAGGDGEDPAQHHSIITFDGNKATVSNIASSGYNQGQMKLAAEEHKFMVYDGWCQDWTTTHYTVKNFALVQIKVDKEKRKDVDPGMCAACPFVYVLDQGHWNYRGEILRNVWGKHLETEQTLALGVVSDRARIRIREEKEETSYIDSVALELADGTRVQPDQCLVASPPAYCANDGRYFVLKRGQAIELTFASLPKGAKLWADGYYVPHH